MVWQLDSGSPIYAQLVGGIKQGIASGEFLPGERIAPVRDLALEAGVNPNTMQRAMQELEREGLVYSQRTSGRYVTEDLELIREMKAKLAREQIRSFLDSMARLGFHRDEVLKILTESIKEEEKNAGI